MRVITPVLTEEGHPAKTTPVQEQSAAAGADACQLPGCTIAIAMYAPANLIGYEVSLYDVKPLRRGGVLLVFRSAEIHTNEHLTHSRQPINPLFQFAKENRWVRILHLERGTQDHNSAILAANSRDALESLTRRVESDPSGCQLRPDARCSWIPAGIAAIPESWSGDDGQGQWKPAF